ncbi:MAG: endonuclease NucS [Pantoea sp.]|uniref:endonuclease NucS domain-containing protein n=1 Tax=Pantoea sp. TaxID=69393 RepID=UPI0039E28662
MEKKKMKVYEEEIRENVAKYLNLLDPSLRLVDQEYFIQTANGRVAYIDILAKDDFGCFTIIEIKKSDQTARSAIQQLMKYAGMLKSKYNIEEDKIRCVVISTVWRELKEAFDEYARVSQYEFKGYTVGYQRNKPPVFHEMIPEYNKGDLSPLHNFIFFEFSKQKDRDEAYDDFTKTLSQLPSCNSVVIKMDYEGDDAVIVHPFGFSWSMFTTDTVCLEKEVSTLPQRKLEKYHIDIEALLPMWELDGEEYALRTRILTEQVRITAEVGEYTGLALHSLYNTLSSWKHFPPVGFGRMFTGSLFDDEDILSMACGFSGDHPYSFMMKTTPERKFQFNMLRKKLDGFLSSNSRWRRQVDFILNTLDEKDIAEIHIYNPMNFFGLIYDLREGASERVPQLMIKIKRGNGKNDVFWGGLYWTVKCKKQSAHDAIVSSYGDVAFLKTRMIAARLNESDEKLTDIYGLTYEIYTKVDADVYSVAISDSRVEMKPVKTIYTLNDFIKNNNCLIDEVKNLIGSENSSGLIL